MATRQKGIFILQIGNIVVKAIIIGYQVAY